MNFLGLHQFAYNFSVARHSRHVDMNNAVRSDQMCLLTPTTTELSVQSGNAGYVFCDESRAAVTGDSLNSPSQGRVLANLTLNVFSVKFPSQNSVRLVKLSSSRLNMCGHACCMMLNKSVLILRTNHEWYFTSLFNHDKHKHLHSA